MSSMSEVRCSPGLLYLLVLIFVLSSAVALAQTNRVSISVSDPRPVAEAIRRLAEQHSVVITYEDPRYTFSGDTLDITEQVQGAGPYETRTIVPKGGVVGLSYELSDPGNDLTNIEGVVESLVSSANSSLIGGRFALSKGEGIYHIVPTEVRSDEGKWIHQDSILDVPITISTDDLNGFDLLDAILQKISAKVGFDIVVSAPRFNNAFYRYRGSIEAVDQPARDVLIRALHGISERLTFLMLYDPSIEFYVMNVLAAEPESTQSSASSADVPGSDSSSLDPSAAGNWPE